MFIYFRSPILILASFFCLLCFLIWSIYSIVVACYCFPLFHTLFSCSALAILFLSVFSSSFVLFFFPLGFGFLNYLFVLILIFSAVHLLLYHCLFSAFPLLHFSLRHFHPHHYYCCYEHCSLLAICSVSWYVRLFLSITEVCSLMFPP